MYHAFDNWLDLTINDVEEDNITTVLPHEDQIVAIFVAGKNKKKIYNSVFDQSQINQP